MHIAVMFHPIFHGVSAVNIMGYKRVFGAGHVQPSRLVKAAVNVFMATAPMGAHGLQAKLVVLVVVVVAFALVDQVNNVEQSPAGQVFGSFISRVMALFRGQQAHELPQQASIVLFAFHCGGNHAGTAGILDILLPRRHTFQIAG